MDLEKLIKKWESSKLEFKETFTDPDFYLRNS